MSTQISPMVKRTAKPTAASILNIIAGAGCVLGALGMGLGAAIFGPWAGFPFFLPGIFIGLMAIPMAALGVLAIIGGVFAVQRRRWRWALVSSIAAVLVSHILGVISIILIALSKDEFNV
jgi:hypothetical protein